MTTLILHENDLNHDQIKLITEILGRPEKVNNHYRIKTTNYCLDTTKALSKKIGIDINPLPKGFNAQNIRLVISDMDSTLIGIECVDEIADMMNLKPQVAAITDAAMRGECDFESSLTQRVALLKGLETRALETVFNERLFLNPGAEAWLQGLKNQHIAFALVSGGFTFFTDRLQKQLDIDYTLANVLEENNGYLTGKVVGNIVGAEAKAAFLTQLCKTLNITSDQTIAIGDGANDLLMMKEAGLSVAYHAKPAVQQQADVSINFGGLDKVLDFITGA